MADMPNHALALSFALAVAAACAPSCTSKSTRTATSTLTSHVIQPPEPNAAPQTVSLMGEPLYAPTLTPTQFEPRQRELETAQVEYDRDPHDEQAIIWVGRRLAYLGRYREAIDVFSNGLAIHPNSFKLRRHRGHRYITLRNFDLALADLNSAAKLIEGIPDEVEPDGQPNKQNIPTSTSHTNIYYHLGLVQYLRGDFAAAEQTYRRGMEFSKNDDMRVAMVYWQYLTLRRLDRKDEANRLLTSITNEMDIIENAGYHRLLLMFKGELKPEQVFKPGANAQSIDIDAATTGYGIGCWHFWRGEPAKAREQFTKVVRETNWAAFGHIAAEAELARFAATP